MFDVSTPMFQMWMIRLIAIPLTLTAFTAGCVILWRRRDRWNRVGWAAFRDDSVIANTLVMFVSLLIGVAVTWGTSNNLSEIDAIEKFQVGNVAKLEVYRMPDSSIQRSDLTPENVRLSIEDPRVIKTFFARLRWAPYRGTSQESFSDGYMIRIVPTGREQPELFISVCRVSSKGPSVAIFSPQIDLISANAIGHYSSPNLLLWLESSLAAGKPVEFRSE